ncbi:MAG: MerR family DNA-binding protein [Planctomycetes bacterium]|nr:MerR family DNA-binding protein [Planctomycetota bacterium]
MQKPNELSIGILAKKAGVNVETVRYYERISLLNKPPTQLHGFRKYGNEHLLKIKFIKRAQELGFSLKEIKKLLSLKVRQTGKCHDVKKLALEKISDVGHRIKDLQRIKSRLEQLVADCNDENPTSDCPIIDVMQGSSCCQDK